jgi:hypothetical protein
METTMDKKTAETNRFSISWSFGHDSGVFECQAKSEPRAVSMLLKDLRSRCVVPGAMDIYRVKYVVNRSGR